MNSLSFSQGKINTSSTFKYAYGIEITYSYNYRGTCMHFKLSANFLTGINEIRIREIHIAACLILFD